MSAVDTVGSGTDLATQDAIDASIAASQADAYVGSEDLLQTPLLKVGQGLTREVQDGNADVGEFINALTGEGLGNKVEFIPCFYARGRFASPKDQDRTFSSQDFDTIPQHWEPYVTEPWVGRAFAEHPESEEGYKARVNAKEIDWGHGPGISTTHNFVGLVLAEDPEDPDAEPVPQPVRLSLKRTDVPAAKKILTLQRLALNGKAPYDVVLSLESLPKDFGKNKSYVINPSALKVVRPTTSDERALGQQLAYATSQGRTQEVGDDDGTRGAAPVDDGTGIAV